MISIYDNDTLAAALAQPINPDLAQILRDRWADAQTLGLDGLTHILVVQPGLSEEDIEREVGFRPSVNPIDGLPYQAPGFVPYWAGLVDLGPVFELLHTVGNDGFAFVLLIEKGEGVPAAMLRMCREHARCA